MPHLGFEMISKPYTRRKNSLQRIFPFNLQVEIIRRFSRRKFPLEIRGRDHGWQNELI